MAASTFAIKFNSAGLNAALDQLAKGAEVSTRPAAQAGAQVLYDEVLQRVPVAKKARKTKSGRTIEPGALKASIYQVFSQDNSDPARSTYHVSWNRRKAPHGHLVEFGTSRAPAHPFLRPSFDAQASTALQAANVRWNTDMKTLMAGLK